MRTGARKQSKDKRLKYMLFAIMTMVSFIAYTMHHYNDASENTNSLQTSTLGKHKSKPNQELHAPFAQRWNKVYAEVEDYLADEGFQKTRFFLDGEIVASNDVFELPTEETGAGVQQYVQDLSDAVVADMVTNQTSGGTPSAGGIGGGAGGGRGDKNKSQYIAKSDLNPEGTGDKTGGSSEGSLSAVPVPPAIWLLSSAILGLVGLRRK